MGEAAFWGAVGGISLLIGAAAGLALHVPPRAIGLIMGFGAGVLVSALAFELTQMAFELGGLGAVTLGLATGSLAFYTGDLVIDRMGGEGRKNCMRPPSEGSETALLLGAVLDGIPESAVIGISLLVGEGIGLPIVAAVFLSNIPESLSSAVGMRRSGRSTTFVIGVWSAIVVVCAAASALGYGLLAEVPGGTIALLQAFAAGSVLTMLADTMMPEAFEHGGKSVGLVTALGFAAAFALSMLE